MIKYEPASQIKIEEFKTPFAHSLLSDNRWVILSQIVPWDKFAAIYMSVMSTELGRNGISPRIVLGALIIKHRECLDDRGTIATIQENPYMQYFIGLEEFDPNPVFDPSLFVEIRKRVGHVQFDKLSEELMKTVEEGEKKKKTSTLKKKDKEENDEEPQNKGKIQMDATVADQYITFPTDPGLLNECREKSEMMIDKLYVLNGRNGEKPRTYRRKMRQAYLAYNKKKNRKPAETRKIKRKLLEAVNRNLKHIDSLLDTLENKGWSGFPLSKREQKLLWVIRVVYEQQQKMYKENSNSCEHRIVNLYQPHVRPIVRGKAKSKTEFGSKLGVSLVNGFARIDKFSWDAYNEGTDLIPQVENYKEIYGYYPELAQVDKIYATRENRAWLSEKGIRITASPLGRPVKKEPETYYQKRKRRKETTERNRIEGKFGQGKNGYNLNKIRARLQMTSESWVACIFFVMNLLKQAGVFLLSFFMPVFIGLCEHINAIKYPNFDPLTFWQNNTEQFKLEITRCSN